MAELVTAGHDHGYPGFDIELLIAVADEKGAQIFEKVNTFLILFSPQKIDGLPFC